MSALGMYLFIFFFIVSALILYAIIFGKREETVSVDDDFIDEMNDRSLGKIGVFTGNTRKSTRNSNA